MTPRVIYIDADGNLTPDPAAVTQFMRRQTGVTLAAPTYRQPPPVKMGVQ